MSFCKKLFLLLRVSHWSKAVFVLLGVIYAGSSGYWGRALLAAFAFCLIASVVYIYNDLQDIEEDKAHPYKALRPLANGDVSMSFALSMLLICLLIGLTLGLVISSQLFVILCVYLLINIFYNHWLRRMILLDVLCIASGFMLRILAGTIGIGLPITWWLTTTATLLSLFIALCKRRLELKLGLKRTHREVLRKYNPQLLDALIGITSSGCFISYLLYAVYAHNELIYYLSTLPFCALGLGRFAYLTTKATNVDDPVLLFLSDNLSWLNLLCFFSLTTMALMR